MKKYVVLVVALMAMVNFNSCGNKQQKQQDEVSEQLSGAIDVDSLLAAADSLSGQEVTVEGVCTHICKHGGRKISSWGVTTRRPFALKPEK